MNATINCGQLLAEIAARGTPRSPAYLAGVNAALEFRYHGRAIPAPFRAGTAEFDAFHAGIDRGHFEWRRRQDNEREVPTC